MPLVIQDLNAVPPERWQFPTQAGLVEGPSWHGLLDNIATRCKSNGLSVPSVQEVVDWCCHNLHVRCYDAENRQPLLNKLLSGLPNPITSCCNR